MKAMVLGGFGFIGSHAVEQLLARGHEVSVFARPNANTRNLAGLLDRISVHSGDFSNSADIRRSLARIDVVVHAVGSTSPAGSMANPTHDLTNFVIPSVDLFSVCVELGVRKIVLVSSGGTVYGPNDLEAVPESTALSPVSPYGISKVATENFLAYFSYQHGIDYSILRLANPYGWRQNPLNRQGVIAAWMNEELAGRRIRLWGDGSVVRDFIAVEDAAEAIALSAESTTADKILNVGSGLGHSLNDVLRLLRECTGRGFEVIFEQRSAADVPRNVLSIETIRRSLGWEPKVTLPQGIAKMWLDLNSQRQSCDHKYSP